MAGVKSAWRGWASSFFLCCWRLASIRLPRPAEVSHVHKACSHCFCKLHRGGFFAAVKAGDAEGDGLRLGVVAGSIPIGDHRAITAEHLHACGHLEKSIGQKQNMVGEFLYLKTSIFASCPDALIMDLTRLDCVGMSDWTWLS